jgi:hypothetical protein
MASAKGPIDPKKEEQVLKELRREAMLRQQGYRDRALKILPHVCGSCGREFSGKHLRELTVHHKDHNWKNNPPDGSNWELLCLFCHDHEHEKYKMADYHGGTRPEENEPAPSIFAPFAALDKLLESKSPDASPTDCEAATDHDREKPQEPSPTEER